MELKTDCRTYQIDTPDSYNRTRAIETENKYIVYPKLLIKGLGFSYGMLVTAKSTAGWQYQIQTFRAVPSHAAIFTFCGEGNLAAVKSLFNLGEASPWDRDPMGRTPLWV